MKAVLSTVLLAVSLSSALAREPMAVTLSFDDSTLDHYVYAVPALERHGYRGTFCLITAWVGTMNHGFQLTWDNVRDMKKRGHVIATHTHDHVNTGKLVKEGKADEVRRQLVVSRDLIKKEAGSAPEYFGAPFASFGPEVIRIAAEEGLVTMTDIRLNHGGGENKYPSYGSDGNVGETIRAWYEKGVPGIDLVFHGIHPKLGVWHPFKDPAELDRALDQVQELEKAGMIRVLGCRDFHDFMKAKGKLPGRP